ncbi:unnamed protein product [Rhizophagus irregularis]|nr:unnamed protein product [Rhizophagus irregularis]
MSVPENLLFTSTLISPEVQAALPKGKKLGLRVIQALKYIGAKTGCYKVILDCSEKNVPFYEKCGFQKKKLRWLV